MKTKVTFFDLEINLDDISFEDMKKYVQDSSDCTLVENGRLRFIDAVEDDYKELIECFEKNTLSKIQRHTIIENLINDINAGKITRLHKVC